MAQTEVTQGQWQASMGANPSRFQGDDARPVEQVSWWETVAYCNRLSQQEGLTPCYRLAGCEGDPDSGEMGCRTVEALAGCEGYRLPTEAEWEFAARAGTETATYAGPMQLLGKNDAPVLDLIAWYGGNSGVQAGGIDSKDWSEMQYPHMMVATHPVGQKSTNAWGLHDMLGNVWEWTGDWYDPATYTASPAVDPVGAATGSDKVIRGGAFDGPARWVRAADRDYWQPRLRLRSLGVRPVRPLPPGGVFEP